MLQRFPAYGERIGYSFFTFRGVDNQLNLTVFNHIDGIRAAFVHLEDFITGNARFF
jgi:hypothetical protein